MPARTIRMRQMREIVRLEGAEVKIGIAFDWHLKGNIPFATDVLKRPRYANARRSDEQHRFSEAAIQGRGGKGRDGWICARPLSGRLELISDVWTKASIKFLGL